MPHSTGPDRLHQLLEAVLAVGSDLSLSLVLRRIVESARSLAGAKYAALGVIDPDGKGLEEFIHVGLDPASVEAIGHLPEGRGVLGLLIERPEPLRIRDLSSHPDAYGFPPHHPMMRSFLGVPVRVGERVYGNLYLTEKQGADEFSEDDEELVTALAAAAGAAIKNARLYGETRRRGDWLEAVQEVTEALLAGGERGEMLGLIARRARHLARADLATVAVPDAEEGILRLEVAEGAHSRRLVGQRFPEAESLSGEVMQLATTRVLEDASRDPHVHQPVVQLGEVGPAVFVPLLIRDRAFGTLVVARLLGGEPFADREVEMVESFARQAVVVLEYGRAQDEVRRLTVLEDRERIARDLHDTVIQRLFATGITLQGLVQRLGDRPEVTGRLQDAVRSLDETIEEIRDQIFALEEGGGADLRSQILSVAVRASHALDFVPEVHFEGLTEQGVPAEVVPHLLATLEEALSNAARHAGAARVQVTITTGSDLVLEVRDDGVGFDASAPAGGHGLRNMARRAAAQGGELEVTSPPEGGTLLRWRVPIEIGGPPEAPPQPL